MTSSNSDVSHHACEVEELRADRQLAAEYLKIALRALNNPDELAAGLTALEAIVEAYGDLESLRESAGVSDQALRQAVLALQA